MGSGAELIHLFRTDPNRSDPNRSQALLAARSDRLVLFDAEDDAGYADAVDILDVIRRTGGRIGIGFSPT
jgi:hypothetical protein